MQMKKVISMMLTLVLLLGAFVSPGVLPQAEAANSEPRLIIDMTSDNGKMRHGASGFLYGISNEEVPTTNTLLPLKPQVLATKGALGTEHPYSDAFDVAEQFFRAGGKMLQMYTSNYYAIFGPRPDWNEYATALKDVICPAVVEWKNSWKETHGTPSSPKDELGKIDIDKALVYLPINEGSPQVDPETGISNNHTTMYRAWETYYKAIKEADPNATVGGPNDAAYGHWRPGSMRGFLEYCHEHDCWPDVQTWHQLDDGAGAFARYAGEYAEYRAMCKEWGEPESPIVINEYATMEACGVPGILMRYIQMIEEHDVYGCLPFWHQANNLNDLTADANEPNSAWWFYKWYADMSGTRKVSTFENTDYHFAGLSALDQQKSVSSTLFGGLNGDATVVLKDIDQVAPFEGATKVHVKLQAAYFKGFLGVSEPNAILEGTYALDGGNLVLNLTDMDEATGYNLIVTPADEADTVEEPVVPTYHAVYEAEDAQTTGAVYHSSSGGYYASGRAYLRNFPENATLTYTIDVPVDGRYRLDFIYGNGVGTNRGDESQHRPVNLNYKLSIDSGTEQDMLLENTMLKDWSDIYPLSVDLTAGTHKFCIRSTETQSEVLMDALHVTYIGAYSENAPYYGVYEAEDADFNTLLNNSQSKVQLSKKITGYHGRAYVTGLNTVPVSNGGGIRFTVLVPESGIYNLSLHYSGAAATANLYLGNSALFMDGERYTLSLPQAENWSDATISLYLEKGLNTLDVDANADIALDYLSVKEMAADKTTTIQATSAIPTSARTEDVPYHVNEVEAETEIVDGNELTVPKIVLKKYTTPKTATTNIPSGTTYVVGRSVEGIKDAASKADQYLEFTYNAAAAGTYALQLFHSNDEIFGTHGYNTKIIDKYARITVNGKDAGRYFFINSLARDTFKEKTVYLKLNAGENKIKIYNDDSWSVKKGLDDRQANALGLSSTSTDDNRKPVSYYMDKPGDIPIVNSLPNFSKFAVTPAALSTPLADNTYAVTVKASCGGTAVADKNFVTNGGSATITASPDENYKIARATVNGQPATFTGNMLKLSNITENTEVVVIFATDVAATENDPSSPIQNNSFGTGTTEGWEITTTGSSNVGTAYFERSDSEHYLLLSGDNTYNATVKQTFTVANAGLYSLEFAMKNCARGAVPGKYSCMELTVTVNGKTNIYRTLQSCENYETIQGTLNIPQDNAAVSLELHVQAEAEFEVYLDEFALTSTTIPMENLAYFVDCGDHEPSTLADGEKFGLYNSVTDQIYGADPHTGKTWGVYDYLDAQGFKASDSNGAYTKYTQPEHNGGTTDKTSKNDTYRYAHGQDSSQDVCDKIGEIYADYKFELNAGQTYRVEVGLGNNWHNSSPVNVYANYLSEKQRNGAAQSTAYSVLGDNVVIEGGKTKAVTGLVTADENGVLTLGVRYPLPLSGRTLDLRYIYIWQSESMEDANKRLSDLVNTIQTADLSELPEPEKTIVGKALAFAKSVISDTTLSGNDIVIVNNAISMLEDAVAQIAMIPDPDLLYFVDCGDHGTSTLSEGDKFGRFNSCTDQLYGSDKKTGKLWGVIDPYGTSAGAGLRNDEGVYTKYTWAHERDKDDSNTALDGLPKTTTFRYANSQTENGISPRFVSYQFETDIADGIYPVEVCFGNVWGNSANPTLYVNYGTSKEALIGTATVEPNGHAVITGNAAAVNGVMTLDVRTEDATINLNYIKVFNGTPALHTHTLTHHPAKAATETETGNIEYWECSGCGKKFKNEAGTEEVTDVTIPKLKPSKPSIDPIISLLPILGTDSETKFPFIDVSKADWYYDSVRSAWRNGLIDGVTATEFRPDSTLTVAQAIKLAAALHQLEHLRKVTLRNGSPWYSSYVEYAVANDIIEKAYQNYTDAQMNAPVTRGEFVHIFHGAESAYTAINTVAENAIPDVKSTDKYAAEIYEFYRAGILTGSDTKGTFHSASSIKRSEVSAILVRMFDTSSRQTITLK